MAAPNIDHILITIAFIEGIPSSDHKALRKQIYHAFYYHNQNWVEYADHILAQLQYGLQYMYAVEATHWIDTMPYGMSDIYD
jgi:hypothetical protein